uniref:AlNc14C131G6972 protein n=1 Tax=Albugo laibachii Nc14 TaxID=890382 RepID=F0WKC0_9STRA|nr:AlNc14C131G6972 [Albugo laibachii Nc14]CCA21851.1 AlNc14C136G7085 [Albugo laibachii Nc14]|eukprot:CCA21851.1 AlNc14C136G7085 [Albugo laibachii Nc14]
MLGSASIKRSQKGLVGRESLKQHYLKHYFFASEMKSVVPPQRMLTNSWSNGNQMGNTASCTEMVACGSIDDNFWCSSVVRTLMLR